MGNDYTEWNIIWKFIVRVKYYMELDLLSEIYYGDLSYE